MPEALAAARLVHYAATAGLFGLSLFPLYALSPGRFDRWLLGVACAALASGIAWLLLTTANMAGSLDLASLVVVVSEMAFGRVWAARMILAAVIVAILWRGAGSARLIAALSGLLLVSISLTGHTQIREGAARLVHTLADTVHLAGAGAWLGGLIGLALMLRPAPDRYDPATAAEAVRRFSRMAYVAVGALVVSGLINSAYLLGAPANLISSDYGRLLAVKLGLFAAMLAFAAVNRLRISPQIQGPDSDLWRRRLHRHVLAEQGLGGLVLLAVAVLGMSEPPAPL